MESKQRVYRAFDIVELKQVVDNLVNGQAEAKPPVNQLSLLPREVPPARSKKHRSRK